MDRSRQTHRPIRRSVIALVALAAGLVAAVPGPSGAAPGRAIAGPNPDPLRSDFDGDGLADLAIGVPFETIDGREAAGAVHVLYGSPGGLTAAGADFFSQATPGIASAAEFGDFFGFTLAAGDVNGDGYGDLAIGAPFEDRGTIPDAGILHLLWGSPDGLTAAGSIPLTQDSQGLSDQPEENDLFGAHVATGDVNGDGRDDLAIGARSEDLGATGELVNAGAVHVLLGTADGLDLAAGDTFITQDTPGVEEESFPDDLFGVGLGIADFDGDGYGDLVVGALGEDLGPFGQPGSVDDAGAVQVFQGSADGVVPADDRVITQDTPGVAGMAETADLMGTGVAAGDINGDGYADLAIEVFAEDVGDRADAGAVNVLFGSPTGLSTVGDQYRTLASPGVPGVAREGTRFGTPVAIADFDGDGFDDLAVGAQGFRVDGVLDAGAAIVLRGSAAGLTTDGAQLWTQAHPDVNGVAQQGDSFGLSLAAANFGKGPKPDLAISSLDMVAGHDRAGRVAVLYSGAGGLSASGDQSWSQDSVGLEDEADDGEFFGFPLAP